MLGMITRQSPDRGASETWREAEWKARRCAPKLEKIQLSRSIGQGGKQHHGADDDNLPSSGRVQRDHLRGRSEEHTSELQSLMRISYAVFCLNKKKQHEPQPPPS